LDYFVSFKYFVKNELNLAGHALHIDILRQVHQL